MADNKTKSDPLDLAARADDEVFDSVGAAASAVVILETKGAAAGAFF
jgi:hypothetical protein